MITIDPYEIDFIIAERISTLRTAGALDGLEPEEPYSYTCEAVFGVCSGDIAAVRAGHDDVSGDLWFQLTDGRIIPAVPAALDPGPVPWRRIEH